MSAAREIELWFGAAVDENLNSIDVKPVGALDLNSEQYWLAACLHIAT